MSNYVARAKGVYVRIEVYRLLTSIYYSPMACLMVTFSPACPGHSLSVSSKIIAVLPWVAGACIPGTARLRRASVEIWREGLAKFQKAPSRKHRQPMGRAGKLAQIKKPTLSWLAGKYLITSHAGMVTYLPAEPQAGKYLSSSYAGVVSILPLYTLKW